METKDVLNKKYFWRKIISPPQINYKASSGKGFIFFLIIISILFLLPSISLGQGIRLSQIDPSSLLVNQEVKVYVSAINRKGIPIKGLTKNKFKIFESADNKEFIEIPAILDFKKLVNYEEGIQILLMVDNSGSMYRHMNGAKGTRIDSARAAINSFLKDSKNPNDRIGLASYNTNFIVHSDISSDKNDLYLQLPKIKRPEGDEGYTEIYGSLYKAVDSMISLKGRKAIIILSDGENRPYFKNTGKKHPDFGEKTYIFSEPLDYCQKEGISVFVVNYGSGRYRKDRKLQNIALNTGGAVFNASNKDELSSIYSTIVNQVLHEYLITYRASMIPADKRYLRINCVLNSGEKDATRFYFASTVFGIPLDSLTPLLLIPLLIALFLMWLLSKINFQKEPGDPSLEVLNRGTAESVTKVISLNENRTIIGGGESADMTISGGLIRVKEHHGTVIFDKKRKNYTLVGNGEIKVNNKKVRTKVLESGDVINVSGTTIVFDDGKVD